MVRMKLPNGVIVTVDRMKVFCDDDEWKKVFAEEVDLWEIPFGYVADFELAFAEDMVKLFDGLKITDHIHNEVPHEDGEEIIY